jgi:uncharacterized protein with GYD domain
MRVEPCDWVLYWPPGESRCRGRRKCRWTCRASATRPRAWARLTKNPEDRREAARTSIESVGGKLHGFWYAFGEHDGCTLWEAPDNVSMAAVAIAIGSGGAVTNLDTTVLLTVEEALDAMGRARAIQYRPPGT